MRSFTITPKDKVLFDGQEMPIVLDRRNIHLLRVYNNTTALAELATAIVNALSAYDLTDEEVAEIIRLIEKRYHG